MLHNPESTRPAMTGPFPRTRRSDSMKALEVLQSTFGHTSFRGQQETIINHVLDDQHALVIMPTGMGKSLCYQIPAIVHAARNDRESTKPNLTLVMSPLIALMKDQVDSMRRKQVDATFINSSLKRNERESRYTGIAQGKYDILYVTPERFRKPEFLEVIGKRTIRLLAIDEAHCISEWGHDFRPDYTRVGEFREMIGSPTTIALTATATPDVQKDIVRQLRLNDGDMRMFHEGIDRPNLELDVVNAWDDEAKLAEIKRVAALPELQEGSGIVYFTLIKTLARFSDQLRKQGIDHVCYHGDLPRDGRRRIQNQFMKGKCKLVLATNAFGMGIDKEDIRFVTHADVPGSMESYYQEIGRAGRDGLPSVCTLLYNEADLATQMEFIGWSNPDAAFYERLYELLVGNQEQVQAFGMEWLGEQLVQQSRHDHRLETALAMFDRHGVVADNFPPGCFEVTGKLPDSLCDDERLAEKKQRDQMKLFALLQYVNDDGDRKKFIHEYFGLPYLG